MHVANVVENVCCKDRMILPEIKRERYVAAACRLYGIYYGHSALSLLPLLHACFRPAQATTRTPATCAPCCMQSPVQHCHRTCVLPLPACAEVGASHWANPTAGRCCTELWQCLEQQRQRIKVHGQQPDVSICKGPTAVEADVAPVYCPMLCTVVILAKISARQIEVYCTYCTYCTLPSTNTHTCRLHETAALQCLNHPSTLQQIALSNTSPQRNEVRSKHTRVLCKSVSTIVVAATAGAAACCAVAGCGAGVVGTNGGGAVLLLQDAIPPHACMVTPAAPGTQ